MNTMNQYETVDDALLPTADDDRSSRAIPAQASHSRPGVDRGVQRAGNRPDVAHPSSQRAQGDVADLAPHIRWGRAIKALGKILANPEDTERVLEFSNLANAGRRDERLHLFFDHPVGARLYRERRAIDSRTVDLDAFLRLPVGTLGHAYATFMRAHGLTPDIFDGSPPEVHDEKAAYVIQRMRQTHDLWHVVTHCETDPAGEIALQAFTFAQLRAPSSGILAALGTLRALPYSRRVLRDAIALYRIGMRAQGLPVFAWEDHWATPLDDVRRMLGLPTSPAVTGGYTNAMLEAA